MSESPLKQNQEDKEITAIITQPESISHGIQTNLLKNAVIFQFKD